MADTWNIPIGDGNSDNNENGALGTITGTIGDVLGAIEEYGDVAGKGARALGPAGNVISVGGELASQASDGDLTGKDIAQAGGSLAGGKPDNDIDALSEKTPQKTAGFFNLMFAKP